MKNDPRSHGGDGLGPVFNGQSCVGCHNLGGRAAPARSTGISRSPRVTGTLGERHGLLLLVQHGLRCRDGLSTGSVAIPTASSRRQHAGRCDTPGRNSSGLSRVKQHRVAPLRDRSRVPGMARVGARSTRVDHDPELPAKPPPLFGAGLIDAIPDEAIEAAARRKFPGSAQVKGRVSRLKDGRIGRFGWKAQTATLARVRPLRRRRRDGARGPRPPSGGRPAPARPRRDGAGHGRKRMRRPGRLRAQPAGALARSTRPMTKTLPS